MTLQRQLVLMIIMILLFTFLGTFFITEYLQRNYLSKQLHSHAQDAATSLGLLLSPAIAKKNRAMMVSIIDATYDRGYYKDIRLEDLSGKVIVDRTRGLKISLVPAWFVKIINFKVPISEALIMSGWKQAGKVVVSSHPGYAYQELWHTSIAVLLWFISVGLVAGIAGVTAVHYLFKPLRSVAEQARAVMNGRFKLLEYIPKTTQLADVAMAMNNMSRKLGRYFEEQRHMTAKLRKQVYHEPLTGLYNAVYFNNHILHDVTHAKHDIQGALFIIEIAGLRAYNATHGMNGGDELLIQIAQIIKTSLKQHRHVTISRLFSSRFGVLILGINKTQIHKIAAELMGDIAVISPEITHDEVALSAHMGIALCQQGKQAAGLMQTAEVALNRARLAGDFTFSEEIGSPDFSHSEHEWRHIINTIIAEKQFNLESRPVIAIETKAVLFRELTIRGIDDQNQLCHKSHLIAMAEHFDMAYQIDKLFIQAVLRYLADGTEKSEKCIVNIAMTSLNHPEFISWLINSIKDAGEYRQRLVFEISEFATVHNIETIRYLIDALKPFHVAVSVDHFGRATSAFSYLHDLSIAFVKIDSRFIREIDTHKENQFYVQSLLRLAHSIDLTVFADEVNTEAEFKTLEKLKVYGAQGDYVGHNTTL